MRNANIISHSSGVIVVIIVVGFMGHWSQLLAVAHGSLAACTQAVSMHSSMVKHVQGHIRQVQHTQTHGLRIVTHVHCHSD